MAEFAASIIGIVSAGTKIALVLSQLAVDVKSAGHEARMIGGEIRSFCSVLKTLGDTIETIEKSPRYAHCSDLISDMTNDSLQMFTEILNAVDMLKNLTAGRGGMDGSFGLVERVQWAVFKKPKLLVLRAAIEAYKTNLTLMLSTLSTAERVARPRSPLIDIETRAKDEQDRSLLESLALDREATLIELVQADRHYEQTAMSDFSRPSTATLDVISDSSTLSCGTAVKDNDSVHDELIDSARNDIQSLRSSLSNKSEPDHEAIRTRIVRHSRRISIMLEDDHRRISQRWSLTLQDDLGTTPHQTSSKPLGSTYSQGHPDKTHKPTSESSSFSNEKATLIAFTGEAVEDSVLAPRLEPIYKAFVTYICGLGPSRQREVLRALERDVAMSNHALRQPRSHLSCASSKVETKVSDSNYAAELPAPLSSRRSVSGHLSSSTLTLSTAASYTSSRPHGSRANSPQDYKTKALPALHYVQSPSIGASFLSDRSRRPPRQETASVSSKTRGKSKPLPVDKFEHSLYVSTVPTPRQDALAKLTAVKV